MKWQALARPDFTPEPTRYPPYTVSEVRIANEADVTSAMVWEPPEMQMRTIVIDPPLRCPAGSVVWFNEGRVECHLDGKMVDFREFEL